MQTLFARRMSNVHKSFIREIMKVIGDPEVISFAGGLPNPDFFPVQAVARAAQQVLQQSGRDALQYSTTEGYQPLREYIASRYRQKWGWEVDPAQILITNGSQQGIDLVGKVFLNQGDGVLLERPGYLGAIQALMMYEPKLVAVDLQDDGIDIEQLRQTLAAHPVKLFYAVPSFQNPSGLTYSAEKRQVVAQTLADYNMVFLEDDPYHELRFMGQEKPPLKHYLQDQGILLGSFSKIISPGLRLGWVYASPEIMEKVVIAKQGADLHSNYLAQRIVHRYLQDNDLEQHLAQVRAAYRRQRNVMIEAIEELFPAEVQVTRPEGGMFVWVTLPERMSALDLLEHAARLKVAFVPGQPFYIDGGGHNSMRLNFSSSDEATIEEGIKRMAQAIKKLWVPA